MITVSLLEKKLNNLVRSGMDEFGAKETLIDKYPDWADVIDGMNIDATPGEAKPTFVPLSKKDKTIPMIEEPIVVDEPTRVIKTELVVNPSEFMENAWRFMSPKDALKHLLNHLPSEDITSVMDSPVFYRNLTDKNTNPVVLDNTSEEESVKDEPVVEPPIEPVVELPRVLSKRQKDRAEKLRILMALQG